MKPTLVSCLVVLALTSVAGQAKHTVTVYKAKDVDFEKFMTYSWTYTRPSLNKDVDAWIKAAVDRELKGHGLRKNTAVLGNVLATYDSVSPTDSDEPGEIQDKTTLTGRWVGSHSVSLLDSGNQRRTFLRL